MTSTEGVPPPDRRLTGAERQLLRWIAEGLTYRQIGTRIQRSDEAARYRASQLFRKLDARDRANAVHIGHRCGLLT